MALIFLEDDAPGKSHTPTSDDWLAGLALVAMLAILFIVLPLLVGGQCTRLQP